MRKFYLLSLVSILCLCCHSYAQMAIDPILGGFDAGNTFAVNGWTAVNSSANKWVVGSTTFNSPPNSAYISIDGNAANYSYDNTTAHISHFYKQVTLPPEAFNIAITFFLKGDVQNAGFSVIDGLTVFTDITAPVADALPGSGAVVRFPQFNSQLNYTQQVISAPDLAGRTFFLIFTWANNSDGIGDGPPASVDGISLTYCVKATTYSVTGGGGFCSGSPGADVGLAGSTKEISYQLYNNGVAVGSPIDGTGSPLDFGPQNAAGTYTIVGTSECGNTYPMMGSVDVTENPLPVASAGSNSPLCTGSTLDLTAGGGTSYDWTGPNGFTSSSQNPSIPNITAAAAGVYTVTVSDNGCSAEATTDVTLGTGGSNGGTISSMSICSGGSGTLTLSGNSDPPLNWESSTDSTSATWTNIVNTGTTQNFSGITVTTFYRAVVGNGCGTVNSSIATVGIHNYWTGTVDTDWNTPANWSDNQVPSVSCDDVYIYNTPNQPVLSNSPVASIKNLHIFAGAEVTVNGTGILQIAGTISNMGTLDVTDGTLELNGTSGTQNIDGTLFKNNTVKNLTISNNVSVAATANDTLKIWGTLGFGAATAQLNTGDNITLTSSATATANVGKLAAGNIINGKVTVERFIATGTGGAPNHGKSWQLLAVPTQGQTIKQCMAGRRNPK